MTLILTIDTVILLVFLWIALTRSLEAALPFVTFVLVLMPDQAHISLPGMFDLTTQRIVILTLAVLYLVLRRRGSTRAMATPLGWLILAQLVWAVISTANSIVPVLSLKKLLSQSLEYYLLYFIFTRTVTQVRTVHRILHAMVAAIFVCCVFGVIQAYTGWAVTDLFPQDLGRYAGVVFEKSERGLRVWSTFPHAILFGAAIAVLMPVALYLLATAKTVKQKAWLWAAVFLMFLNIYKTSSRGPWLALALGSMVLFAFGPRLVRRSLLGIGVLSVVVLMTRPGIWRSIDEMYVQTLNPNSMLGKSYEYRYALRGVAQQALARDPTRALWGYGMESFYYLNLRADFAGRLYYYQSCDSTWIEFMVETGYVGLFLIALLLLKAAWLAWSGFRKLPKPQRYLSLVLCIGICTYYFAMLSVDMYSWGQEGFILWAFIALSVVYVRLESCRVPQEEVAVERAVPRNPWLAEQIPYSYRGSHRGE
jgi:hypothetical protein